MKEKKIQDEEARTLYIQHFRCSSIGTWANSNTGIITLYIQHFRCFKYGYLGKF